MNIRRPKHEIARHFIHCKKLRNFTGIYLRSFVNTSPGTYFNGFNSPSVRKYTSMALTSYMDPRSTFHHVLKTSSLLCAHAQLP